MTTLLLIVVLSTLSCLSLAAHAATWRFGLTPVVVLLAAMLGALHTVGAEPIIVEAFGTPIVVSAFVLVPAVLLLPLVVYEVDGTAAARVIILGVVGFSAMVMSIQFIREVFAELPTAQLANPQELKSNWLITGASTAALLTALSGVSVLHQWVSNTWPRSNRAIVAGIALMVALWADDVVFRLIAFGAERFSSDPWGSLPEKTVAALVIWPFLSFYLQRIAPSFDGYVGSGNRAALDMFLGTYSDTEVAIRIKEQQRQDAMQALAASRIQFEHTFSEARVGLLHTDIDGKVHLANPYFLELVALNIDELVDESLLSITHPNDQDATRRALSGLRENDASRFELDVRLLRKDGATLWTHLTGASVKDPRGQLPFIVLAVEDLTQRRETEAQLRQAQKMEAVGQLTGGVAHDFNNLLTVVMSGIELALLSKQLEQRPRELLEDSLDSAERGARLIQQLLSFSRRQSLQPQSIVVPDMLKDCQHLLDRLLGEKIDVELDVDADVGTCIADRSQLESALLNLALNARDAMPDGGSVRLAARHESLNAEAAARIDVVSGTYVVFSVVDQGTGLSPEDLERAVEPFYTTKPPGVGSGLGLSMVYGFATQSGGGLLLESELGQGTTASIYLPNTENTEPVQDDRTTNPVPAAHGSE